MDLLHKANSDSIYIIKRHAQTRKRNVVAIAKRINALYEVKITHKTQSMEQYATARLAMVSKTTLKTWHKRLAHSNYISLKQLAKDHIAYGFEVSGSD